ncbi:hypothetical protein ACH0BO_07350 [Brevibacterium luteolum]|uniref:hypothetical protein n=1 Tax=Brevibacterium luteolum TaxID=199591 RepID=UPI00387929F6
MKALIAWLRFLSAASIFVAFVLPSYAAVLWIAAVASLMPAAGVALAPRKRRR